jgi:hypothetical protein
VDTGTCETGRRTAGSPPEAWYRPTMAARLLLGIAVTFALGCDDKPSIKEQMEKTAEADAKRREEEDAKKAADAAKRDTKVEKDPNALELPWTSDSTKAALEMGTTVEYAVSGTDAKGKPVQDTYYGTIKANNAAEVGVNKYHAKMAKDPVAKQVAMLPWGSFSPFFPMEKPEHELVKLESVEVPAGKFDTVVVELRDVFGAHQTVWLIKDKPGIYAKVVEHGNANMEDDKTEITYDLTKIGKQ